MLHVTYVTCNLVIREGNRRLGINLHNLYVHYTELTTAQVTALVQSFWLPPPPCTPLGTHEPECAATTTDVSREHHQYGHVSLSPL